MSSVAQAVALLKIRNEAKSLIEKTKQGGGLGIREILGRFYSEHRNKIKTHTPSISSASSFGEERIPDIASPKFLSSDSSLQEFPAVRFGDANIYTVRAGGIYTVFSGPSEKSEWEVHPDLARGIPRVIEENFFRSIGLSKSYRGTLPSESYVNTINLGEFTDFLTNELPESVEYVPLGKKEFIDIISSKLRTNPAAKNDFKEIFGVSASKENIGRLSFGDLVDFDRRIGLEAISPFFDEGGYRFTETKSYRVSRGISLEGLVSEIESPGEREALKSIKAALDISREKLLGLEKDVERAGGVNPVLLAKNLFTRNQILAGLRGVYERSEQRAEGIDISSIAHNKEVSGKYFDDFFSLQFACEAPASDAKKWMKPQITLRSVKAGLEKFIEEGIVERDEVEKYNPKITIHETSKSLPHALAAMESVYERTQEYRKEYQAKKALRNELAHKQNGLGLFDEARKGANPGGRGPGDS